MISFFRRALSSWAMLGLLGLIMIAFIITGVGTPDGLGLGGSGGPGAKIATVGGSSIAEQDITRRVDQQIEMGRRENPAYDTATFIGSGQFEPLVNGLISSVALDAWGRKQGLSASDRLIDGEIASIQAFKGPTGKFDRATFDRLLASQRMSEKQLRADLAGDLIRRQLIDPVGAISVAPARLAGVYASLLIERREGQVGVVPISAIPEGPAPTPAQINSYYTRNISSFTLPERRALRYAVFGAEHAKLTPPTEAEIAAFYKANGARYAATESRSLSQIVLPDEAAARAFVAKVRGGTAFGDAARAAGFAPTDTSLGKQTRAQISELASPAAASAAFAAAEGAITDPQRSPLGWHVIRVDAIETNAGKPLADVRDEIVTALTQSKSAEAMANFVQALEDEIGDGATFDEVAKKHGLTAQTTPPLLASGQAPDVANWQTPAELTPLLKTAFDAALDDDPSVEAIGETGRYALLDIAQIVPSAPVPLAQARPTVLQAIELARRYDETARIAKAIADKASKGMALDKAFAEAGVKLPAPQKAGGRQAELAQQGQPVPPPLQLMFSMTEGTTRTLSAPGRQGFFVVHLDTIERADASKEPNLIASTQQQLSRLIGSEYVEQFAAAVEKHLGVKRDTKAIDAVKAKLASGTIQ